MRITVTARNSAGTGSAVSATSSLVQAAGSGPANTSPPTISGTPQEGLVLNADKGQWSGTQPIAYAYQWQRCDQTGANCADVAGATGQSYTAATADVTHMMRVRVAASNSRGSQSATSSQTALVAPARSGGAAISVSTIALPDRLIVDRVQFSPSPLQSRQPFTARFHVTDTRGFAIQGALVYALGLPYSWLSNAPEVQTDGSGWATITMQPTRTMPLRRGGALVIFVRARKSGDDVLAGVSTRRLVQVGIQDARARPARPSGRSRSCQVSVTSLRARDGWTRFGSPGIFGKFGGYGASPTPSFSSRSTQSSRTRRSQTASSIPACRSPSSAKRCGIDAIVKSSVSTFGSSSHLTGAETVASGRPRTEYAERIVRSRAFWL
jgi:hypothetical protein